MKLAITVVKDAAPLAPFVLRGDYVDTIREAAAIGYDAVELHIADPAEVDADAILSACREAGVSVSSIGTGLAFLRDGVTLTHPDEAKRQDAQQRIASFIKLGGKFGCVVIIGLIKGQVRDVGDRALFEERFRHSLDLCLVAAEKHGVTLVMEAVNRYESDIFNTIAECMAFIDKVGSGRLKIHIDTFHMNTEEDRIGANVAAAAGYVGHVHVADSNRRFPGCGHYDFAETISALKQIGYRGALSVECHGLPTPRAAAEGALSFLRKAI
ncbi:sugar phosphate isomerase/epimerase (plasmid) [Bosea sp. F3-2]|uniref:sugar phosphate isomerase/epimerase family protein n=1 Tax=Bosea sp. F3-2 TaxID=2599640 RepID=UPI0011F08C3F|nr:sugar phosphate isomerase/epimerase family protein [Bosea sp. F3-2]QEL27313.1 sugar phosphate isomerase/epimerase [Bosea sp. F3-2]